MRKGATIFRSEHCNEVWLMIFLESLSMRNIGYNVELETHIRVSIVYMFVALQAKCFNPFKFIKPTYTVMRVLWLIDIIMLS